MYKPGTALQSHVTTMIFFQMDETPILAEDTNFVVFPIKFVPLFDKVLRNEDSSDNKFNMHYVY